MTEAHVLTLPERIDAATLRNMADHFGVVVKSAGIIDSWQPTATLATLGLASLTSTKLN